MKLPAPLASAVGVKVTLLPDSVTVPSAPAVTPVTLRASPSASVSLSSKSPTSIVSTPSSDVVAASSIATGASFSVVTFTVASTFPVFPPDSSVNTKRTVRASVLGLPDVLRYDSARTRLCTRASVASLLNVTVSIVPPVSTPPDTLALPNFLLPSLTSLLLTEMPPNAPIDISSMLSALDTICTVSVPFFQSSSASVTVAPVP